MLVPVLLVVISSKVNFISTVLNVQHLYFSLELRMMNNNFQTSVAYSFI